MKSTIKTGVAAILLLAISCTKESITTSSSVVAQSTGKALTFTVGQHYGGGIIFYIDSTGQHGLLAGTADLDTASWWNGQYIVTGAVGKDIGTGRSNTNKIVTTQGKPAEYAAILCHDNRDSGYRDWYLPSKDELNELFRQRRFVGGFANGAYWSSSEFNSTRAWCRYFTKHSDASKEDKSVSHNVRPIRAF